MPNIQSAKKRLRQSTQARLRNNSHRSRARTFMKKVASAIQAGDHTAAVQAFSDMQSVLDKLVKLHIFHRNTVARYKSRINKKVKMMLAPKA